MERYVTRNWIWIPPHWQIIKQVVMNNTSLTFQVPFRAIRSSQGRESFLKKKKNNRNIFPRRIRELGAVARCVWEGIGWFAGTPSQKKGEWFFENLERGTDGSFDVHAKLTPTRRSKVFCHPTSAPTRVQRRDC